MRHYDFVAMPVVDAEDRLLGVVTIDDVVDVIQEENTEDAQRMVGAGADEKSPATAAVRPPAPASTRPRWKSSSSTTGPWTYLRYRSRPCLR